MSYKKRKTGSRKQIGKVFPTKQNKLGTRKHLLLTKALKSKLPPLYSQENNPDPKAIVKFFDPTSQWTWYATEFDGKDTFFGLVVGHGAELGYFSLSELENVRSRWGLPIERDKYFDPTPLSKIRKEHGGR